MKSTFSAQCCALLALSVCLAGPAVAAGDIVSSKDIATRLLSKPKALQQADGKWVQPDPTIDLQVPFEFKQSKLTEQGKKQLDELALAFQQPGLVDAKFELAGHTDQVGGQDYNLKLSQDRANAVRDYLAKRHGIATQRMSAQGYGYTRLADPQNPSGAVNRRVEVRHLMAAGYGSGMPVQPMVPQVNPGAGYGPAVIVPQPSQPAVIPPVSNTFPPQTTGGRLVPRE